LETWRPHGLGHGEGAAGAVDQPSDEFVRFHRITMRCLSIRLVFSKLFQDAYFLIVRPVSQAVDLQCVVAVADVSPSLSSSQRNPNKINSLARHGGAYGTTLALPAAFLI
jgi:hypothetical protein